jgi:hypothetical protein
MKPISRSAAKDKYVGTASWLTVQKDGRGEAL